MSNTKHTPGPWNVTDVIEGNVYPMSTMRSLNVNGMVLAHINAHYDGEANARLIAAAPELLAALRLCVLKFSQLQDTEMTLGMARALDEARAAIAKAEGQS